MPTCTKQINLRGSERFSGRDDSEVLIQHVKSSSHADVTVTLRGPLITDDLSSDCNDRLTAENHQMDRDVVWFSFS